MQRAERRAQEALARAGFADPAVAAEVLRVAQVLSLTATLAMLDYATPRAAEQALAGLITPSPAGGHALARAAPSLAGNGHRPFAAPAMLNLRG